jgi:chemotaxis protein methyltransferase CheR
MDGNTIVFDTELVKNIIFVKQKTNVENDPGAVKLTIFRNQTIYYNQLLHEKVLQKISTSMVAGGFLALGVKETLENTNAYNKFTVFNDNEKIYKRKTT